jgi:hypothetical protein
LHSLLDLRCWHFPIFGLFCHSKHCVLDLLNLRLWNLPNRCLHYRDEHCLRFLQLQLRFMHRQFIRCMHDLQQQLLQGIQCLHGLLDLHWW